VELTLAKTTSPPGKADQSGRRNQSVALRLHWPDREWLALKTSFTSCGVEGVDRHIPELEASRSSVSSSEPMAPSGVCGGILKTGSPASSVMVTLILRMLLVEWV
jgi:hypothetical protein